MNRYRVLLQPRWILGHLVVILSVILFVNLGLWQLRRLDERQARNATIEQRSAQPVLSLDDVAPGVDIPSTGLDESAIEFRRVEVDGTYLPDAQLLTAPRGIDGRPGQQVLAVIERDDGSAVLIDRGYVPFDSTRTAPPPAPSGDVRISGVLRDREPGEVGNVEQVRQIVPDQLAERLGVDLAPYYVQLTAQQPHGAEALTPTPLPELTEGSHLSYALQWFSFALIAVIGYAVLLRRSLGSASAGAAPTERERPSQRDDGHVPVG